MAKKQLSIGNQRFVSGHTLSRDIQKIRNQLTTEQRPFAVVLSCSDSRVPPELIFDQTLGKLFVIRVAGNVLDDDTIGSIEYAIEHFHSSLIVVMGHENCGAIKAAIDNDFQVGHIPVIVKKISPSLQKVKQEGVNNEKLETETNIENVLNGVNTLLNNPIIKTRVSSNQLQVLGAEYHLSSGSVEWLAQMSNK